MAAAVHGLLGAQHVTWQINDESSLRIDAFMVSTDRKEHQDTVIYEAHVKGTTVRHPKIPDDVRNNYGPGCTPFNMAAKADDLPLLKVLLGLGAATNTGDPMPAVLFGVPGGAASAATAPISARGAEQIHHPAWQPSFPAGSAPPGRRGRE